MSERLQNIPVDVPGSEVKELCVVDEERNCNVVSRMYERNRGSRLILYFFNSKVEILLYRSRISLSV